MKSKIFIIIIIFYSCYSCKSKINKYKSIEPFEIIVEKNSCKLIKKPQTLSNEGKVLLEKRYTMNVPTNFISCTSTISKIPNEIIFEYKKKQIIFIFGNKDMLDNCCFLGLNAIDFKKKLIELKIDFTLNNKNIENFNFYNGISIKEQHIILYLNVEGKNLSSFSNSIKSFKYL